MQLAARGKPLPAPNRSPPPERRLLRRSLWEEEENRRETLLSRDRSRGGTRDRVALAGLTEQVSGRSYLAVSWPSGNAAGPGTSSFLLGSIRHGCCPFPHVVSLQPGIRLFYIYKTVAVSLPFLEESSSLGPGDERSDSQLEMRPGARLRFLGSSSRKLQYEPREWSIFQALCVSVLLLSPKKDDRVLWVAEDQK